MNSTTTNSMPNLTELFSGNMFTFDDVNSPMFTQHMEMMAQFQQQHDAPQQEVLLSSIMNPMDDDDETPLEAPSTPSTPKLPTKLSSTTTRDWRIIHCAQDLQDILHDDAVKIAVKTRDDKTAHYQVPDKLYSSLRYVLSQKLDADLLQNKQTVLMSKIQVVNPQTHEEIRKKNNEYVIDKGNTMVELKYNPDSKCYECTEKIKFLDNSYRHNDIKFAFKISFYDASQPAFLTHSPIIELLSAPFHVRARRPPKAKRDDEEVTPVAPVKTSLKKTKKATTASAVIKKRKIDEVSSSDEAEEVKKKAKTTKSSPVIATTPVTPSVQPSPVTPSFSSSKKIISLLDKLALAINALPEQERSQAYAIARTRLEPIESLRQPIPMDLLPAEITNVLNPPSDVDLATYTGDDLLSFEKFL
jgi:hypothetical protein